MLQLVSEHTGLVTSLGVGTRVVSSEVLWVRFAFPKAHGAGEVFGNKELGLSALKCCGYDLRFRRHMGPAKCLGIRNQGCQL